MLIFIRDNVGIERGRGENGQKRPQTQHYRPHPQYLPALPPAPTGLTPSPSPRGEGSDMPCALTTCCWLTCQLVNWLTRQLSNHSPTSQTLVN